MTALEELCRFLAQHSVEATRRIYEVSELAGDNIKEREKLTASVAGSGIDIIARGLLLSAAENGEQATIQLCQQFHVLLFNTLKTVAEELEEKWDGERTS